MEQNSEEMKVTQVNVPEGVINLGVGQPAPSLLPLDLMHQAAEHRLSSGDSALLAYGTEQGDGYFRVALAGLLAQAYGIPVRAEQLFITNGSSQGLDLLCTLTTQPGDTVLVEEPSYFLALRIFADHHLNVVSLPMDSDGLVVDALEAALVHHTPRFLYTVPTFHNPSAVTMTAARRARLVALAQQHNFKIIADEVYHLLSYTKNPPPPLPGYDDSGVVMSLGSFSKILAPGLRLGWIQANPAQLEPLITCGLLDSGGGLNPFTSGLVRSAIELGLFQTHLVTMKRDYQRRAEILQSALRRELPDTVTFEPADGGFFVWLRFPEAVDVAALLPRLREFGVVIKPGEQFSSRKGLKNCARLCFTYYDGDTLMAGVKRLAAALDAQPQG